VRSNGTVVAWGGQTTVPAGLTNVVAVSAASSNKMVLTSDGNVVSWGVVTPPPAMVTNVVAIAAGYTHSVALLGNGTVAAWGNNSWGQTTLPTGLTNVVALAGGEYHSLALRADGTVVVWGDNDDGQANVPGVLANAVGIAGGNFHSLALVGSGTPRIVSPILDRTGALGGSAFFRLEVVGQQPWSIQWFQGNRPITGATNSVLTFDNLQLADSGQYSAMVSNALGSVTSVPTRLSVVSPMPFGFVLGSVKRLPDGKFQWDFTGQLGTPVDVLTSTNLADWSLLTTVTNETGALSFTDPATNFSRRFYRLRQP